MINEIKKFISRFVVLNDDAALTALALYVVHTWSWQHSQTTPYLYIWSPLKQSGKTRLLEVLEMLVHAPVRASSITSAALYRVIEQIEPTMLIDEVDTIYSGAKHDDLRGTLNSGYKLGGQTLRIRGGEITSYSTFCPKVLAGINNLMIPDTVADRCVSIELQRKPKDVKLEPFYYSKAKKEAEPLLDKIDDWVIKNKKAIEKASPVPIKDISDRKWEIGEPLVIISNLTKTRNGSKYLKDMLTRDIPRDTLNQAERVLKGLAELFDGNDKLFSADIAAYLDMSPKMLANHMDMYGIKPRRIRIGTNTKKGYHKSDMRALLERNL